MTESLLEKLRRADICCMDCGKKYGKYSVGCSSVWTANCPICDKIKGCTEVRDFGYLAKGIGEELAREAAKGVKGKATVRPFEELTKDFPPERKARIKEQSKSVADYMLSVGPIMDDSELEDALTPSYEQGEIVCKFTEAEITALADVLDAHEEEHPPGWNEDYDSAFEKIHDLFNDYCIKYELSPAFKAYYEKYKEYPGPEGEDERWEGFRDAFVLLSGENNGI